MVLRPDNASVRFAQISVKRVPVIRSICSSLSPICSNLSKTSACDTLDLRKFQSDLLNRYSGQARLRNSTKTTTSFYHEGTRSFLKYPSWSFVIFVVGESLGFNVMIFVLFLIHRSYGGTQRIQQLLKNICNICFIC